jgi:signal transduction histidine kinase
MPELYSNANANNNYFTMPLSSAVRCSSQTADSSNVSQCHQMSHDEKLHRLIDWFIPEKLLADREMRVRARMFIFSHMFGPIIGNIIPALLWLNNAGPEGNLSVLAGSICAFWTFPFLLKYTGRYELLSFVSIQNLLFAILWGCYFLGGLSSPFLPWLVTVPLLAFFYLRATQRTCVTILLQISVSLAAFIGLYIFDGRFSHLVDVDHMGMIGTISIISASVYVSMMALFYAGILASQTEFENEVSKHLETAEQLRKATAEAERGNAAKADFLAKMSHELRTPLNAIIGYSELLLEETDPDLDPQGTADTNKIRAAGKNLLALVNDILDLSKIEAGKMEVFNETVDPADVVQRVVDRSMRDSSANGRTITSRIEGEVGNIHVDVAKLEQVLDQLVDNALRYAPGSDVKIVLRAKSTVEGEKVEISVVDRGPGIPPEIIPTLFETFSDVEDYSDSKYGGPGLGLPLCYRLCELMACSLTVRTDCGKGATIVVEAPRISSESHATDQPHSELSAAA